MNNVKRLKDSQIATSGAQDNAAATATIAAPGAGQSIYVTGISGGFSAAAVKTLQLKDGTTVKATFTVNTSFSEDFASPIKISAATAASAVLAASGTVGVTGVANLKGYVA